MTAKLTSSRPPSPRALPDLPSLCLAITERAPLPMATLEGASRIVRYGNPAFCRLVNRPIRQFVGRPLDELLPKKDVCLTLVDRVYRTKKAESYTEQEPSKPHPIFWSYTIWPVEADKGLINLMIQVTETAAVHDSAVEVNQALILGSLRQNELTEATEKLNGRLEAEIVERKRAGSQLRVLWEAARVLLTTTDPNAMLRDLLTRIGPVLGLDTYFNYMVDETGHALRLASCAGVSPKIIRSIDRLDFGPTISGTVARQRRSIYVPRVQQSRDPKTRAIKSFGLRAYVCHPLMSGKVLLGTLSYGSRSRDKFDPDELAVLQAITYHVAVAYERLLAAGALRVSETRYRRLFEAANDGILLLDPGTRHITDANPCMTKLLGYPRRQLIGLELFEIGLLPDAAESQAMFRKLKKEHDVRYEDLPLKSRSGRHQEVEVVANLYSEDGQSVIQCNIRDITQRKRAEELLRQSEALFFALLQRAPFGVYVVDDRLRLHQVNPKAMPVFQKVPRLLGRGLAGVLRILWPRAVADDVLRRFRHTLLTGEPYFSTGFTERRRDIELTESYEWQLQHIALPAGRQGVVCFFNNITERKATEAAERRAAVLTFANREANKEIARRRAVEKTLRESELVQHGLLVESQALHIQMRNLTHQIITAQEGERKKISRELHDDVMQTLVGINAALGALTKQAAGDPAKLKQKIADTQQVVKKTLTEIHRFARDLRPSVLDDFGLIPALQIYCKTLAARKQFRIRMTAPDDLPALDNNQQTVLFRVAQEALTNVARHARARLVKLRLMEIPGAVRMEVQDDGKSFDVQPTLAAKKHRRLGLLGMRERIEMVGGTLVIESSLHRGTLVRADIPIHPGEANG